MVEMQVATLDPAQSLQALSEGLGPRNQYWVFSSQIQQDADLSNLFELLCTHGDTMWPRNRCTTKRDEHDFTDQLDAELVTLTLLLLRVSR